MRARTVGPPFASLARGGPAAAEPGGGRPGDDHAPNPGIPDPANSIPSGHETSCVFSPLGRHHDPRSRVAAPPADPITVGRAEGCSRQPPARRWELACNDTPAAPALPQLSIAPDERHTWVRSLPFIEEARIKLQNERMATIESATPWLDDRGIVRNKHGHVIDVADRLARWLESSELTAGLGPRYLPTAGVRTSTKDWPSLLPAVRGFRGAFSVRCAGENSLQRAGFSRRKECAC